MKYISILAMVVFHLLLSTAAFAVYEVTYSYDDNGRLTRAEYDTGLTIDSAYDKAGNILTLEKAGGGVKPSGVPLGPIWLVPFFFVLLFGTGLLMRRRWRKI